MTNTHDLVPFLKNAIVHYLDRSGRLLDIIIRHPKAADLLATKLAPDGFDTGFHLAVGMQFAARAVCFPVGAPVPEIVEPYCTESLKALHQDVLAAVQNAPPIDWSHEITHTAGRASLLQSAADYVIRFAYPNMLFHLSQAYAGLRLAGMDIGKEDFDGLHKYR